MALLESRPRVRYYDGSLDPELVRENDRIKDSFEVERWTEIRRDFCRQSPEMSKHYHDLEISF